MTETFRLLYGEPGETVRTIKDDIIFLVDKGVSRSLLIEWLTDPKSHLYLNTTKPEPPTEAKAIEEIDKLIEDGTLTMGQMHGGDFIVVTDWMPRTAARLQGG